MLLTLNGIAPPGAQAFLNIPGIISNFATGLVSVPLPEFGWVYVDNNKFRDVTGTVVESEVSHTDFASEHDSHDQNTKITVDPQYRDLLSFVNDLDLDHPIPANPPPPKQMEIEWETGTRHGEKHGDGANPIFPKWAWPSVGDRVWVNGSFIYDVGHSQEKDGIKRYKSEIHPPRAFATMRDELLPLPGTGDTPVPVTATDLYIHGDGGYATDVLNRGSAVVYNGDLSPDDTNPINTNFHFDIHLPPRPSPSAVYAYTVVDGPGNTKTIHVDPQFDWTDATRATDPVVHVTIPLGGTGISPHDVYARRIKVGWVYAPQAPDEVHHLKVTLDKMVLHDDKSLDPDPFGHDDHLSFMWLNVSKAASEEWIRLADSATGNMDDYEDDGTKFFDITKSDGVMNFSGANFDFYVSRRDKVELRANGYAQKGFDDIFGNHLPLLAQAPAYLKALTGAATGGVENQQYDDFHHTLGPLTYTVPAHWPNDTGQYDLYFTAQDTPLPTNQVINVSGDRDFANENDRIEVTLDPSGTFIWVWVNNPLHTGVPDYAVPKVLTSQVNVFGLGGNNTLIVDFANGNPIPAGGIHYDGGSGGTNRMILQGGKVGTTTYLASGPHSGTVLVDGLPITYANLAPIDDTTTAGSLNFFATNGNNTIGVTEGPVVNGFQTAQINSGANGTFELVNFANKGHVTINGLGGNNTLTVDFSAGDPIPAGGLNYKGGGGVNQVVLHGGTTAGEIYQTGFSPGSGTIGVIDNATGLLRLLHFEGVTQPVSDDIKSGVLNVLGTPADNAINVTDAGGGGAADNVPGPAKPTGITVPPTFGLVTVDNFLPIGFANKSTLVIDGQQGTNTIHVNEPQTPTGLTGILINGGNPASEDRLIVNGVAKLVNGVPVSLPVTVDMSDPNPVSPAPVSSPTIRGAAGAGGTVPITFQNIDRLTVSLVGDTPALTIKDASDYAYTPAAAADAGTVIVTYTNLVDPTLRIDFTGLPSGGTLALAAAGAGNLVVNGTPADDHFVVAPANGAVLLTTGHTTPMARAPIVPTGIKVLTLNGQGGADTFTVTGHPPYQDINLIGGGLADGGRASVTGDGSAMFAAVGDGLVTLDYGGVHVLAETGVVRADSLKGNFSVDDRVKAAAVVTPADARGGTFAAGGTAPRLDFATDGTFTADLTDANQTLVVNATAPKANVAVNGATDTVGIMGLKAVNYKGVKTLAVNGQGGGANFTVTPSATVAYSLDGGDPAGASRGSLLTIVAGANLATFNGGPTSDSGSVVVGGNIPITFRHIEAFDPTGGAAINRTLANEIVTVQAVDNSTVPFANGVQDFTVSVSSGPQFLFLKTPSLQVNARGRNDEVIVQEPAPQGADWNVNVTIDGGSPAGNGSVLVQATGGNGASYAPSSAHGGMLTLSGTAKNSAVTLANVKQLTYDGGGESSLGIVGTAANKTITVTPGAADDAGVVAVDRLLPIAYEDLGTGGLLSGLIRVDGGGGTDTLVVNGTPGDNAFRAVTLASGNTLVRLNDRGTIAARHVAAVRLVGGAGDNSFDATGAGIPVTFDGGTGHGTLTGPNAKNAWEVTGTNAGKLNGSIQFVHVQNLVGGGGTDTFTFDNGKGVTGTIDGGGGFATLDYTPYKTGVRVNLDAGTATGVAGGVSNVHNVTGGQGNDLIIGDDAGDVLTAGDGNTILVGGAGANILTAGKGQDILIGGRGKSVLNAPNGGALMIAGFTDYDTNVTALLSLMAEWSRPGLPAATSYSTRMAHLTTVGGGGLNGKYVLKRDETVFDNGAVNALNGTTNAAAGLDWLWAVVPPDIITKQRAGEVVSLI
jgi:hypothetical protein